MINAKNAAKVICYLQLFCQELELYDESLTDKPSVLVVNKMDVEGSNVLLEELKHQMDNYEGW